MREWRQAARMHPLGLCCAVAHLMFELWCVGDGLPANVEGLAHGVTAGNGGVELLREGDGRAIMQLLLESDRHDARHTRRAEGHRRSL